MLNFFQNFRNFYNFNIFLKIFFYVFPLMMLKQSGYITAYVTFLTIISFFYLYKNNFKIIFYFSDYLIFLFFILSIFSTLINIEKSGHDLLIKSILDIRFAFLFLIIRNLFNYKILNFKTLLIITCICTVFLCIDIFIQHIYGKDLFGFEPWHGRYAGIFNDEAIAGSYIQKFSFISIPLLLLLNISNFKKILLIVIVINILGLGILMSTDRVPFFIYLFQLIILIIISNRFRFIYLISIIFLFILSLLIFKNNSVIKKRYALFDSSLNSSQKISTDNVSEIAGIVKGKYKQIFTDKILKDDYFKIFYTGYVVWEKNPIFGTGIKSFNRSCSELLKSNKEILCAPHGHNLYLEILVNMGIVGFFFFLIFIFSLSISIKKNFSNNSSIYSFLLIILIAELWPFRSYGSIFQTVNGSMFWYLLALISCNLCPKK